MKSFAFKTETKGVKNALKYETTYFLIEDNRPIKLGTITYYSNSFRGHSHEVVQQLVMTNLLPTKALIAYTYEGSIGTGYIDYDYKEKHYHLFDLNL